MQSGSNGLSMNVAVPHVERYNKRDSVVYSLSSAKNDRVALKKKRKEVNFEDSKNEVELY